MPDTPVANQELIEILERFQNPGLDIALVADLIADEIIKAGYRKVSADRRGSDNHG